jgi:exodeoxyribonuclease I
MGFVFYDTETTGLRPAFDQIIQFAAIRTDDKLNPVERLEVKSRLMPHVLPSPEALCITGVGIDELCSTARPSFLEMMCSIYGTFLGWSPSTFVGFNSARFDEAFLHHGFYQTLHPAYLTSNHGNARGDALRLARAVHALRPDVLTAGAASNGDPSFRLQDICAANGFRPAVSHEAMADVEAVVWLCRLIAERADDIWSYFSRFAYRVSAQTFLREEAEAVILVDPRPDDAGIRVLTWLGSSEVDRNLEFCVDLSADVMALRQLDPPSLLAAMTQLDGPVRRIRINRSPMMLPLYELENLQGFGSENQYLQQVSDLREDADFVARLLSAARAAVPDYPQSPHLESQLYGRFATREDEQVMAAFHSAEWAARPEIIRQFGDERFLRLGHRQIFFERPDLLDHRTRASMHKAIAERQLTAHGTEVPWTTIAAARMGIEAMLASSSAHMDVLARYQSYLDTCRESAEGFTMSRPTYA